MKTIIKTVLSGIRIAFCLLGKVAIFTGISIILAPRSLELTMKALLIIGMFFYLFPEFIDVINYLMVGKQNEE